MENVFSTYHLEVTEYYLLDLCFVEKMLSVVLEYEQQMIVDL
jgi:hypothetical protein